MQNKNEEKIAIINILNPISNNDFENDLENDIDKLNGQPLDPKFLNDFLNSDNENSTPVSSPKIISYSPDFNPHESSSDSDSNIQLPSYFIKNKGRT